MVCETTGRQLGIGTRLPPLRELPRGLGRTDSGILSTINGIGRTSGGGEKTGGLSRHGARTSQIPRRGQVGQSIGCGNARCRVGSVHGRGSQQTSLEDLQVHGLGSTGSLRAPQWRDPHRWRLLAGGSQHPGRARRRETSLRDEASGSTRPFEGGRKTEKSISQFALRRNQDFSMAKKYLQIPDNLKGIMLEEHANLGKQAMLNLRTLTGGSNSYQAVSQALKVLDLDEEGASVKGKSSNFPAFEEACKTDAEEEDDASSLASQDQQGHPCGAREVGPGREDRGRGLHGFGKGKGVLESEQEAQISPAEGQTSLHGPSVASTCCRRIPWKTLERRGHQESVEVQQLRRSWTLGWRLQKGVPIKSWAPWAREAGQGRLGSWDALSFCISRLRRTFLQQCDSTGRLQLFGGLRL